MNIRKASKYLLRILILAVAHHADLLKEPIAAINVGVQDFGEALEAQGAQVIYVEWSPPAGGDQEMIDLLDLFM